MADIDLALGTGRDISVVDGDLAICSGLELIAQRVIVGLRLFLGEDLVYPADGIPYYRDVLVNAPRTSAIEALFRRSILSDPDVLSLTSFGMSADKHSRTVSVKFSAVSAQGIVNAEALLP